MVLNEGNKVVYPSQGPCVVSNIVKKEINGTKMKFYQLVGLGEGGAEVLVPVEKAEAVGLRQLLKKADIPKLIAHIKKPVETSTNWKQRSQNNSERITSGSAFRVARVVRSLTDLSQTKKLSAAEVQTLARAKALLVSEIAHVMGIKESLAEARIDKALETGQKNQ